MRNGKDRRHRLPILVCAINILLMVYADFFDYRKKPSPRNFWSTPNITYNAYLTYNANLTYKNKKEGYIKSKIPKASFYRILNNLVDDGYILKISNFRSKYPDFFISLKGVLFLMKRKPITF